MTAQKMTEEQRRLSSAPEAARPALARCPSVHCIDGGNAIVARCPTAAVVVAALLLVVAVASTGSSVAAGGRWPPSSVRSGVALKYGGECGEGSSDRTVPSAASADAAAVEVVRTIVANVPTRMRRDPLPATIVLPASYGDGANRTYPALYLLHGAGGGHGGWAAHAPLADYADLYDIIIVCPDGGRTSWYFDSPVDAEYQYETFVSREVVRYVDSIYRTRPTRGGRAIMGNSMGGHGALFLAIRHPGVFGTAVSLSGGVDIRPFPDQWNIKGRIGPIDSNRGRWDNLTVVNVAKALLRKETNLAISLDCGAGDFFLEVNREFHRQLLRMDVPHDYAERPGGHGWAYWKRVIRYQMAFVDERLNKGSKS